jgi:glutaconate CoA-transferase, subunit B
MTEEYTSTEMMVVAAARQLAGERVCFVGVGPPNIACNLARRTVAPELELVYESGVFGAVPERLPLSIGDPSLVTGSALVTSQFELFAYYLQGGLIDVGFLGASQIDRFGNINTTAIGDYAKPKVRLPGSGGACEIAINAKKVFVIMPQSKRSFVERVDFVTSPGHLAGARPRSWLGAGPSVVVTDLGVYTFDDDSGEMELASLHPGISVDHARDNAGWPLRVRDDVRSTPEPTPEELSLIREELDPDGAYTR